MRGYPASKMTHKWAISPMKRESNAMLCELMRGYAVLFEWSGLRVSRFSRSRQCSRRDGGRTLSVLLSRLPSLASGSLAWALRPQKP